MTQPMDRVWVLRPSKSWALNEFPTPYQGDIVTHAHRHCFRESRRAQNQRVVAQHRWKLEPAIRSGLFQPGLLQWRHVALSTAL